MGNSSESQSQIWELSDQLEILKREKGRSGPDTIQATYQLAEAHIRVGNMRAALDLFGQVLSQRDDISASEAIRASFHTGGLLLYLGKFEQASQLLTSLVTEATLTLGRDSAGALMILRSADESLYYSGNVRQVLETGNEIIEWHANAPTLKDKQCIEPLLVIAQLRLVSGDETLSSALFKRVIRGCIKTKSNQSALRKATAAQVSPSEHVVKELIRGFDLVRDELVERNANLDW